MDCCCLLPLPAPQPAVDNRSELERAFKPVIRQQAAAVHEGGRIRTLRRPRSEDGKRSFRVSVGGDGTLISPCWTFPDGRDSIRGNLSDHIADQLPTFCLFSSVETACRVVSRRDDRPQTLATKRFTRR
ncbi:MAG: hypothetical protein DWI00_15620 [Planctomycetota bacterium]|nr:MAG: hypothetical protein DWI00_15620 [Planctomycetota bacterium]